MDADVLVVVPDHLVGQWRKELATKFFVSPEDCRLTLIGTSSLLGNELDGNKYTLVVLDEAHRIASQAFSGQTRERSTFERLCRITVASPRLLLLSGTPVLRHENQFLAMLHLLDPSGYPLSDLDTFRKRVQKRQLIAEATADLMDQATGTFAEEAVTKILEAFGTDERLAQLCGRVQKLLWVPEESPERISALRELRTHLTETYKLHRRLLRTKRSDPRIRDLLPSRNGAVYVSHRDPARSEASEFLDTWRVSLDDLDHQPKPLKELFATFVAAAMTHPRLLVREIERRLSQINGSLCRDREFDQISNPGPAFNGEAELLSERSKLITSLIEESDRSMAIRDWAMAHPEVRKFVIFVSDPIIADHVCSSLQSRLRDISVIRYKGRAAQLREFETDHSRSFLVCDQQAEEGLNLQRGGAAIVHYDLPLDPWRIEQRIGRVDRIEARARITNIVVSDPNPYERRWLECLSDAIGVFNRSVAPLQYLLSESILRIHTRLLTAGSEAFEEERALLLNSETGVSAELRRIATQETIDSITVDSDEEAESFARLLECDESLELEGQASLDAWVTKRLQFDYQRLEPEIGRYIHNGDRTLVPLFDAFRTFEESIDRESNLPRRIHQMPLIPMTFSRELAEAKNVSLLRVGNPILDALVSFVRSDDRGSAYALWRYVPNADQSYTELYFRFDFYIEADVEAPFNPTTEDNSNLLGSARRRADAVFPVQYETVWIDSDLGLVTDRERMSILHYPYSRHRRDDGGFDRNLNSDRWQEARSKLNVFDWAELCIRARDTAESHLTQSKPFLDKCRLAAQKYRALIEEKANILDSRLAHLEGPAKASELRTSEIEEDVDQAILRGIEKPKIRVDSVGCVVISTEQLRGEDAEI